MRTNYVILYSGGSSMDSEIDQEAVLKDWDDWYTRIGLDLVDAGNPFSPRSTSITSDGRIVQGGADCAPTGYVIIQAESLEAAVALAKVCPILKDGAKVSVYEAYDPSAM